MPILSNTRLQQDFWCHIKTIEMSPSDLQWTMDTTSAQNNITNQRNDMKFQVTTQGSAILGKEAYGFFWQEWMKLRQMHKYNHHKEW